MRCIARLAMVVGIIAVAAPVRPAVAGGGCHAADISEMTTAATTEITMHDNCFNPTVAHVPLGAAVRWVNKDPTGHTVTGVGWGSFDEYGTAAKMRKVWFNQVGVYPYYCLLHVGMAGAVVVGDGDLVKDAAPGSTGVTTVRDENSVRLGARKAAASGPAWPAPAAAIGFVCGGLGFGIGRRIRSQRPEEAGG